MGSAFLIGAGGLGVAAAEALALGGVARLTAADPDEVALSNLHRQACYTLDDVGRPKAERLGAYLASLRSDLVFTPLPLRLKSVEALVAAAAGHDILLDGSDNAATRFAANDAALALGIPLVHGAALGLRGQVMTILPGITACLRCLFESPPEAEGPVCRDAGVLGPLAGEIGWRMGLEGIKLLRGEGRGLPSVGRMTTVDLNRGRRRVVEVGRRPDCLCQNTGS
ncbi:MAG: HesA/MoeB/ThiF family protein [Magnetococcales bacterium]|nr:HesA/MoeB/ThiF family protein [Magnetococcales bacterium]